MNHQARWSETAATTPCTQYQVIGAFGGGYVILTPDDDRSLPMTGCDGQHYPDYADALDAALKLEEAADNAPRLWLEDSLSEERARHIEQLDVEAADLRCEEARDDA